MKAQFLIVGLIAFSAATALPQIVSRGQTIVGGEYFTNKDPGAGNGTPIPATFGSATAKASFTAQVPSGGVLYFRFESSDGTWSAPQPVLGGLSPSSGANLIGGEYFINSDPGIGKGTSFAIGAHGRISISPPALTKGDTLYMRVKDSYARWSPTRAVRYDFFSITNAQYYVKCANGAMTPTTAMTLKDSLQDYPVFIATSSNMPVLTSLDTVRVRVRSENGFWSEWFSSAGVMTAIQNDSMQVPGYFRLYPAYPNPFNPSTTIAYQVPQDSHVVISVYDVLGRVMKVLVNQVEPAGSYRVVFDASRYPSGVYFYRLMASGVATTAVNFVDTKKFVVVK